MDLNIKLISMMNQCLVNLDLKKTYHCHAVQSRRVFLESVSPHSWCYQRWGSVACSRGVSATVLLVKSITGSSLDSVLGMPRF